MNEEKVENFSWGFTLVILGLLIQWFFSNESLAVYASTLLIAVGVYYVGTELSEVTANDGYENLTFGLAVVVVGSSLMSFLDSSSAQIIIFILFGLFGIYYIFTGTYKVIADLTERVRAQRSKKEPPSDNDEKKRLAQKKSFSLSLV